MSSPLVKYCPQCGAENSRLAPFCAACGDADLSTVPPEPVRIPVQPDDDSHTRRVEGDPPDDTCVIELVEDPQVRFTVRAGQTVGRTSAADVVLTGVPYLQWISGAHARFLKRGDQWYAQHIGRTNFIRVDGESYEGSEEVAICDGSVLSLSLSTFRVRLPQ